MSEQLILKKLVVEEGRSFDMYFKPKVLNEIVGAIQAQTALTQQEQMAQRSSLQQGGGGGGMMMMAEEEEPLLDSVTVGKLILNHLSQALQGRKNVDSKDITEAVDQFRALRGARAIQNATVQPLALSEYPPIAIDPGNIEYKDVRTATGVIRAQSGSVPPGALGGGSGGTSASSGSTPGAGGQPGMADVFNKGSSAHATGFHVPAASSPLRRVFAIQQRYYFAMAQTSRSPLYVIGTNQQVHSGQLPLIPLKGLEGSSSTRTIAVLGILTYEAAAASTAAPGRSGRKEGDEVPGKSSNGGGGDFDIGASTGQWYLEDCTMRIELGIAQAQALSCGIFAAGAIVIARGVWDGGRLQVQGFSFPPPEPRSRSLSIVNNLDCFGLAPHDQQKALQMEAATSAVVITCAHMHLDRPQTLRTVQMLFSKLQGMDPTSFTFVFSGAFTSKPRCLGDPSYHEEGSKSFYAEMVNLFTELGETIKATAPLFAQQSQFIIVPGPSDITNCGNTLPQFPLSAGVASGFKHKCPKTTLSPNPCRLRFGTCEMVVARIDSQRLWKKPRVVRPLQQTTDGSIFTRFDHVAKTIVEQHSIAPFLGIGGGGDEGIEPVWAKDHALRLFPLPHFLVVCDSSEQWQTPCGETELVNPGCFSLESTFLWLEPAARKATVNVVSD